MHEMTFEQALAVRIGTLTVENEALSIKLRRAERDLAIARETLAGLQAATPVTPTLAEIRKAANG